jgi:RNA polymerase sigma factor (sigma-70 family)
MINAIREDEDNNLDEYDLISEQAAKTIEEHPILFEELLESLALSARERMIIDLFIENYSQTEIAKLLGISDERVRQLRLEIGEKLQRRTRCTDTMESLRASSTGI